MAFKLFSDVRETSTTGGTGDQILTGSAFDASYFRWAAAGRYSNGDTFFYCMKQGTAREIGLGTYVSSGDKIARTTVYKSTNSNNLVNFSAGQTIDIFVTLIAPQDLDATGLALLLVAMGAAGLAAANSFSDTTDASSSSAGGAMTVAGGLAVAKKLYVGGALTVSSTTDASSSSAGGALTVAGGLAVAKRVYLGSSIEAATNSIAAYKFGQSSAITGCTGTAQFSGQTGNHVAATFFMNSTGDDDFMDFGNNSGLKLGGISKISGTMTLVTASDARWKDVKGDLDPGDRFDRVSVRRWDWTRASDEGEGRGFVAQELAEVFPEAVIPGDRLGVAIDSPEFVPWSVTEGALIPFMVAEIKSLRARVRTLEGAAA